jgi:predicted phage terminase large subunit-like protein
LLCEKLEAVGRGEIDRLLICMPPGAAKSTYTSFLFPAFFLSNHPSAPIIAASHTAELSERWGRRVRNLIAEESETLNLRLRADSQAAGRWQLESGGEYLAAGVGQAILGFRADLIVIDDPTRSREDAMSEPIRTSIWEWYRSDLRTRLRPGGRVVLISTRWHELDLPGMLLDEMDKGGEIWDTLILPAIAEEGDPLGRRAGEFLWDDDAYGYGDHLRRELATQSPSNWASLFQCRPSPESGDYFKSEWLRPYTKHPPLDRLRIYAASDFAVTSGKGDYTVHLIVGIDQNADIWILDLWRGQTSSDIWVEKMLDLGAQWQPLTWALEAGGILSAVMPLLQRRIAERRVYLNCQHFPSRFDKATRAQSIRGKVALDGLHVPTRASWYAAFAQEWLSFPQGRTDDIIDCLALIGRMLPTLLSGRKPTKPDNKKMPGYAPYGADTDGFNWKLL